MPLYCAATVHRWRPGASALTRSGRGDGKGHLKLAAEARAESAKQTAPVRIRDDRSLSAPPGAPRLQRASAGRASTTGHRSLGEQPAAQVGVQRSSRPGAAGGGAERRTPTRSRGLESPPYQALLGAPLGPGRRSVDRGVSDQQVAAIQKPRQTAPSPIPEGADAHQLRTNAQQRQALVLAGRNRKSLH